MPAYTTAAELNARFGTDRITELSNHGEDADSADAAAIAAAIARAEDVINRHLAGVAALPLDTIPQAIKTYAQTLALYFLHDYLLERPDAVEKDAAAVRAELRDLARGKLTLGLNAAGTAEQPQTAQAISGTWNKTGNNLHADNLSDFAA